MKSSKVEPIGHKDQDPDDVKDDEKEEKENTPTVSISTLFRYATGWDKLFMLIGTFCGMCHGAIMPVSFIVFGELITVFTQQYKLMIDGDKNAAKVMEEEITKLALYMVYLGIGNLVLTYGQMMMWSLTAARQIRRIRLQFFKSILNQDIGWFDCNDPGELNNRLTIDLNKVYDGIGHKIALFVQATTQFFAGFGVGFGFGWELTLVLLAVSPLLVISGAIMAKLFTSFTEKELNAYAKAGSIAEEALSSIRTVTAFGGEEKEFQRYSVNLRQARDFGIIKGIISGLGYGSFQIIMFGSYALSFWYGSTLVIAGEMQAGDLIIVFFAVMIGAFSLGQAGPNLEAIATARGAAYNVFSIIDRKSPIDPGSDEGHKPEAMIGNIEFKHISFVYPSRQDVKVLNEFNLTAGCGQTVALVGESGCGKSTIVKLIQRFYDPQEGEILIDGKDIRSLNVAWLRHHTGVVSQEPVLFDTTVGENIRYGANGVTDEDIEAAAKRANAHDFISKLPQGYNTLVGERGAQLSGGQKQRVAIARAIVRDPKILLLDEATSALDTESESVVQAALDKAREGRTTIVIAHRLSTVRNADLIAAVKDGAVVEMGTHEELLQTEGVYHHLVALQTFEEDETEATDVTVEQKALHFTRNGSNLSSRAENEPSRLQRRLSVHKQKPGSASDKAKSELQGNRKAEAVEPKVEAAPIKRILKLNTPEWPYISVGILASVGVGAYPLVFAMLISEVLNVFTIGTEDEQKSKATFWSLLFLALGAGAFLCYLIQNWAFAKSGEVLTLRLRQMAFKAIMRQPMSYFDDPSNSTGSLCTILSTHAADVKGAAGIRIGTVITAISMGIACATYAFVHDWRMTLLVLAFTPFFVVSGAIQAKVFIGKDGDDDDEQLESGKIAVEAIENIRTIASLGVQRTFYDKYARTLDGPHRKAVKKAHFYGVSFGMSEAIMFFSEAAAFRFGAFLMADYGLSYLSMMKVIFSVMIGAMTVGELSAFSPDYAKAKIAAARLFKLLDSVSTIDSSSDDGEKSESKEGNISLCGVKFHYPSRPDIDVLRGIDLTVSPGQRVALVGSSGCGKSTVVSLLQRFYDVQGGQVAVNQLDVKSLNVRWLRSQIGIVSQEPVLFSYSIAENIAYGDNTREVSIEEIEDAAKRANIHNFINTLPKGYETNVGDKGTLISGGQKQRIAIARALVRNPRILLLDEATSALDTESEKVVQEALDEASEGRTTIVIAHRLSTIQSADCIAVLHRGQIVEQGNHQELLALKGTYHSLVMAQMQTENETRDQ